MTDAQRITKTLKRLLDAVAAEAAKNPAFASSLAEALGLDQPLQRDQPKRPHRRAAGILDPFSIYADAREDGLRRALSQLSIEQLKDIVAEHGMDRSKLAMRWRTSSRLVDLILETVSARARKGDAFR